MPPHLIHCPQCDCKAFWREKDQAFVCKNEHTTPLWWCMSASHSSTIKAEQRNPFTDSEFAHIAFRLNECRCDECKRISEKLCDLRENGTTAAEQRIADVIRPHVLYFALCMEQKLRTHDEDRGDRGWVGYVSEDEVTFLLRRVFEEARELRKQVTSNPLSVGFSESHDVGNFAMMLDTAHYTDADLKPMIKELLALLRGKEE